MLNRPTALAMQALILACVAGCAGAPSDSAPITRRPLLQSLYSHDLVAPREPPAFVVEPVRQERRGYVWAHSYSRWDGQNFIAVPGQWIAAKPDYRYVDATWERHSDGWHFKPGHWLPL